jgi:hypothetical protein
MGDIKRTGLLHARLAYVMRVVNRASSVRRGLAYVM